MAVSSRRFQQELFREHLDEVSFLYQLCRSQREDPTVPWSKRADFEQRMEAHLDALRIGGHAALEVAATLMPPDAPGDLYAVVATYCRQRCDERLSSLLQGHSFEQIDDCLALRDAIADELPADWQPFCVAAASSGPAPIRHILAAALTRRQVAWTAAAKSLLSTAGDTLLPMTLWSLARSGEVASWTDLADYRHSPSPSIRRAALLAGLRLHDPTCLQCVTQPERPGDWLSLVGMCGGRRSVPDLLESLARHDKVADIAAALGLLGDLSAVRPLVALLDDAISAPHAAHALHLITGAELWNQEFRPESVEDDELFEDELQRRRSHSDPPVVPVRAPLGSHEVSLCHDASAWNAWLQANASRFQAAQRYRFGKPCSPLVIMLGLSRGRASSGERADFIDELMIRYGISMPFEADMKVEDQQARWPDALETVLKVGPSFDPGGWYFAGRRID